VLSKYGNFRFFLFKYDDFVRFFVVVVEFALPFFLLPSGKKFPPKKKLW
jgi:hypothetical protein